MNVRNMPDYLLARAIQLMDDQVAQLLDRPSPEFGSKETDHTNLDTLDSIRDILRSEELRRYEER